MSFELEISGLKIGSKDKVYSELSIYNLSNGSKITVEYVVITGSKAGPVLYVGAGSHGDEITSIYVALKLAKSLGPDDLEAGAIIINPIHNPLALINKRRQDFINYLDMNRIWPGDPNGSPPEIIANKIFNELILKSDYVIDLHTASSDGENLPHVIIAPPEVFKPRNKPYAAQKDLSLELAKAFRVGYINVSNLNKENRKYYEYIYGELHVVSPMNGIPALTVELGEGGRISQNGFNLGYEGVINVAKFLNIVKGDPLPNLDNYILLSNHKTVRSPIGGIVSTKVHVGEYVKSGSTIATVENLKHEIELKSPIDGYIVRVRKYPVVEPGERIATIAEGTAL